VVKYGGGGVGSFHGGARRRGERQADLGISGEPHSEDDAVVPPEVVPRTLPLALVPPTPPPETSAAVGARSDAWPLAYKPTASADSAAHAARESDVRPRPGEGGTRDAGEDRPGGEDEGDCPRVRGPGFGGKAAASAVHGFVETQWG